MDRIQGLTVLVLLIWTGGGSWSVSSCRISEFACQSTGRCIRLDEYCDGKYHCADRSDEPPSCTACNRTYYGDVGKSYRLSVKKFKDNGPFLCHLSFTASGQENGDFIELVFEEFRLGMLDNGRCVGGEMKILELGRPYVGGSWCGFSPLEGNTPAVYYSEAGTVTMTLRIPYGGLYRSIPFGFDLRFKFLSDRQASVRLGTALERKERGAPVPGTHCSRNFYECYRKKCALQSPNYPGMYPRNVSCHYTIRQKVVPKCKHAMVALSQKHSVRMLQSALMSQVSNETAIIRVNDMCKHDADMLVFHDGPTEDDPVLLTFCGGPVLPRVVSTGPAMLVVFKSSAFDTPATFSSPVPVSVLRSFELDLQIAFVDSDSLDYSRSRPPCEFTINASSTLKSKRGVLNNPQHSIPPNSTCTYRFQGLPEDRVWLFFESYGHRSTSNFITFKPCPTRLRIWDGAGTLLGDHCDAPRLCEHVSPLSNTTRLKRPCSLDESYLSKSPSVILQVHSVLGTVLEPINFKLHYEFVDSSVYDRENDDGCVVDYNIGKSVDIAEPKNVFLYGRGGARSLQCLYRLRAEPGYRMQVVMRNASFGSRECAQSAKTTAGKFLCPEGGGPKLAVREVYWQTIKLERGCFCQNFTETALGTSQVTFDASSDNVEILFQVPNFAVTEDFTDTYFNVHVRVMRSPECPRKQWVRGSGGEIELVYPLQLRDDLYCHDKPWLLEARPDHSMFIQTWGHFLPLNTSLVQCKTKNRVLLYELSPVRLIKHICPAETRDNRRSVHMFSDEWTNYVPSDRQNPRFLVEFVATEPGSMAFKWLEVSKPKSASSPLNGTALGCAHGCPELNACISSTLWCDGHRNCPSGVDEADLNCQTKWPTFRAALETYGVPVAAVALFGLAFALLAFIYCAREPEYKAYEEPDPATTGTDNTRSCSTIAS
ncbi:uncharacterized protein LOC126841954 [Adelges cooleyi]|uniref:uncharacterized protein LOC126841954 n=1 Tax=Adelges cooleyi TaxID=133065 RepID=UPI00217F60D1|nr:uncharacterized protein LOC126841954 [Adelges cooleyi]XP_050434735.1 uncharacterized protein LOC126841954 [Adelges cooleyi]